MDRAEFVEGDDAAGSRQFERHPNDCVEIHVLVVELAIDQENSSAA